MNSFLKLSQVGDKIAEFQKNENNFDYLAFANNQEILKHLDKDGSFLILIFIQEKLQLSLKIGKYKSIGIMKPFNFLVTTQSIYVLLNKSLEIYFLFKMLLKEIKKKFSYYHIMAITSSNASNEFILHLNNQHDQRFNSDNIIFECLVKGYTKMMRKPLGFFFKANKNLQDFATSKINFKKGIIKMPTEQPIVKLLLLFIQFRKKLKDNETLKLGRSISVLDKKSFLLVFSINKCIIADSKLSLEYYEPISIIGIGSLATIFLVERKDKDQFQVLKVIPKQSVRERIGDMKVRININEEQNCPFLVQVEGVLQTQKYLIFIQKYMSGGDLYTVLSKQGRLLETQALFYFCEILIALEAIHQEQRIYRDLKLENVLVAHDGHIALTDYGLSRLLSDSQEQNPFFGTPEYLAPELFTGDKHSKASDFWCLGILLYELLIGIPPFYSENQSTMYQAIVENDVLFPSSLSITENCKDIITQLLSKDPQQRLGFNNGVNQIKKHPWVSFVNWSDIVNKKLTPPLINQSQEISDNFDKEFLKINSIEAFENLK